jgi:hypothetical protein
MNVPILMTEPELTLFTGVIRCSSDYLEFGSGGSTYYACCSVSRSVVSIDSLQEWIDNVNKRCSSSEVKIKPRLVFVDIGITKELGYPSGTEHKSKWPHYHSMIWSSVDANIFDVILVDGRFRVACFLQALLRCDSRVLIMIHDFSDRPYYHVVHEFAHEIAKVERLSVFQRKRDFSVGRANACLDRFRFDPR